MSFKPGNHGIDFFLRITLLYFAPGINTIKNSNDGIFNNSSTDLANETITPAGDVATGYAATHTIGVPL